MRARMNMQSAEFYGSAANRLTLNPCIHIGEFFLLFSLFDLCYNESAYNPDGLDVFLRAANLRKVR